MVHSRCGLVLVLVTTSAFAGKPKAHITCESAPHPVDPGKPARLGDELACTITVDSEGGYKDEDLVAKLRIIPPKKSTLLPIEHGGPLVASAMGPAFMADAWKRDTDFHACEPFVVEGTLSADTKPVWTGKFAVAASCAKPKKVTAAIACHYTAQDGTVLKWPGNGVKLKPRLERTFSCSLSAKVEVDVVYDATLGVVGAEPKKGSFLPDGQGHAQLDADFDESVYHACGDFAIAGEVRAGGVSLWTGKLPVKQFCPD